MLPYPRFPGWPIRAMLLAALPLALAACGGEEDANNHEKSMAVDPDAAMDTTPAGTPAPPSPGTIADDQRRRVSVRLLEWDVQTSRDTVPAGEITFEVMNTGTMEHALEVEGGSVEEETDHIAPGGTATLTLRLEPGTYELYCPVVNGGEHRARGMRTELVVSAEDPTLMAPPGRK